MSCRRRAELAADPRVRRGMGAQLAERERRLAEGEGPLGWKVGFGSKAAMASLGIGAPLIGFITDRSLTEPGVPVSVGDWRSPALEPEVMVRIGSDFEPGDRGAAERAIAAVGPAFELVDVHPPPEDVEEILTGNVFHRRVALGPTAGPEVIGALVGRVRLPGRKERVVDDPQGPTGELVGLIAHVADLLDGFGERLRGGEVVICGSIVPPIVVSPGDLIAYRLEPVGEISLRLG